MDIKDVSVFIRTIEESKAVQERYFSYGKTWRSGSKRFNEHLKNVFFYIYPDEEVSSICWQITTPNETLVLFAKEFLEQFPEKTPKQRLYEDTELYEAVIDIANNICNIKPHMCCPGKCFLRRHNLPCVSSRQTIERNASLIIKNRQIYIDYANELRRKDPTKGGKYILLNAKGNPKICKAWSNSIDKNGGIVKHVDEYGYETMLDNRHFVGSSVRGKYYALKECVANDGMPTGRALIGLYGRIRACQEPVGTGGVALIKQVISNGCYFTSLGHWGYAEYIDQDLAKQLMGEN